MHSHFTMSFPSFHFTTLTHPSHPHHNLLHFTTLHFTSLHFTSLHFWTILPHLHFALFITFLTLFLKLLGLQERVPKASAGSWFQSWLVLFTKEWLLPSTFCTNLAHAETRFQKLINNWTGAVWTCDTQRTEIYVEAMNDVGNIWGSDGWKRGVSMRWVSITSKDGTQIYLQRRIVRAPSGSSWHF
jgi:hypothetical protein